MIRLCLRLCVRLSFRLSLRLRVRLLLRLRLWNSGRLILRLRILRRRCGLHLARLIGLILLRAGRQGECAERHS